MARGVRARQTGVLTLIVQYEKEGERVNYMNLHQIMYVTSRFIAPANELGLPNVLY